jgi:periplasmic protein TonB
MKDSKPSAKPVSPGPENENAGLGGNITGAPFMFDTRQTRLSGALGASIVAHGVLVVVLLFMTFAPRVVDGPVEQIVRQIVWLPEEGPGGGGGGGGNQMPEPPQKAELEGKESITVPVERPKPVEPVPSAPEPPAPPEPELQLNIPAQLLASAERALPGVLEGPELTGSRGTGVGGGAGTGTGTGIGPGTGSGLGPGWGGGTGGGAYRPGSGIDLPIVLREIKPQYTAEAMRAKIQGTVWLEAIVLPDGTVGSVQVTRSLDPVFGLDDEAVKAARQWLFRPGTRQGTPVPVIVTIELTFRLR